MDNDKQGIIFNIQKFSVHDGKGIRTLVFLKGCPLHCAWCSNPESQHPMPQRAFNPMRCLGATACARCVSKCPTGAMSITNGLLTNDFSQCTQCFTCTNACPSGAQTCYGETKTVDEVLRKVEEDEAFYARSGGGLSLSGGEAMMQPKFVIPLLREARNRYISTAMETCGIAKYEDFAEACKYLNELIYDIKHASSAKHKEFTGMGNETIISNFISITQNFPNLPITVRTPVVPGFNDTWEEIEAIYRLIPHRPNIRYELLDFHRMGEPKYEYLGKKYPYSGVTANMDTMTHLRKKLAALA